MKTTGGKRAHKAQHFVFNTSLIFEVVVAFIVIISIAITILHVPEELMELYHDGEFIQFLKRAFDIIIGIEFLKMLCRHDLDSVVEVLLFAVARSIIIEHMGMIDTMIGVLAIGILFLIRKYLFVSALDEDDTKRDNRT